MGTTDDLAALTRTRLALQAVAEHILAAALHQATQRIGLRQSPGGFATPWFPHEAGQRQLRVEVTDLVVASDDGERRAPLTTLAAAGELVGVTPGAPRDVYTPATPLDLDAPLDPDPGQADRLADWYALAARALAQLRADHADHDPAPMQLWPEHFDLATTVDQVNYGASPGDATHPRPYLYVGPWDPPEPDGAYWNESFGASLDSDRVTTADDALAFYRH